MKYSFLIDECLSPELSDMAVECGHVLSTNVRDRGWGAQAMPDHKLFVKVLEGEYTFVTKNTDDFLKPPTGQHHRDDHFGLVCLNFYTGRHGINEQRRLFAHALELLDKEEHLINRCLEITDTEDMALHVEWHTLPQ